MSEPTTFRGRKYVSLELASLATQTHLEVLVLAERMNGVHVPPGDRLGFFPVPAIVAFTGIDPDAPTPRGQPHPGMLRQCGWAGCPGLAASVPIHEHDWGFAHELCRTAMNAAITQMVTTDEQAIVSRWAEEVHANRRPLSGAERKIAERLGARL